MTEGEKVWGVLLFHWPEPTNVSKSRILCSCRIGVSRTKENFLTKTDVSLFNKKGTRCPPINFWTQACKSNFSIHIIHGHIIIWFNYENLLLFAANSSDDSTLNDFHHLGNSFPSIASIGSAHRAGAGNAYTSSSTAFVFDWLCESGRNRAR